MQRHYAYVRTANSTGARVTRGLKVLIDEGFAFEAAQLMFAAASQDAREGAAAFIEKRKPVFPHVEPMLRLV